MPMMKKLKLIAGAVLAVLAVIVVLQNTEPVETRLLFVSLVMPRAVLLFGTLAIGFNLGVLTATGMLRQGRHP